jgi:hypothetical protein
MLGGRGFDETLTEAEELETRADEIEAIGYWKTVWVTVAGVQNGVALERRGAPMSRARRISFVDMMVS